MLRAEGKKKGVHLHHEGAPVFFPGKILKAKLIILFGLLLLTACSREKEDAAFLQHVDSLADMIPEQADTLLSSSQDSSHYARLLRVKVDDKLYRPVTGYEPLVIDTLLPYFQRHGDSHRLSTALFYAGRICADKGDAPQAIDYYQQTLNALPRKHNPAFRALIYNQIGTLFYYQELFEEAYYHYHQAYLSDSIGNDTTGMIYDLRDIGNTLHLQKKWDSAIIYYNNAIKLAELSKNRNMYLDVTGQVANLYLSKGDYERVIHLMQPVIEELDSANISPNYFILSNAYYQAHQQDSAVYYYNKLLQYGNVYGKQSAFLHLSEIALKNKKINIFKQLHDSLRYYDDSIKYLNNATTIARMHSLYNYQLRERQLTAVKQEKNRQYFVLSLSIIILLAISFVILMFSMIIRQQRNKERKRRLQTEQLLQLEKERNGVLIKENQEEINHLRQQQSLLNEESHELLQELEEKIRQLEMENQIVIIDKERQIRNYNLLMNTEIVRKIHSLVKSNRSMNHEDFHNLSKEIDLLFPKFRNTLFTLYNMSETEYHVCMLMKLDIYSSHISILVSKARNSIAMIQKRLFNKMFKDSDTKPFNTLSELIKNI